MTVYRLITAGTVEDNILRLHNLKRNMADALLQDTNLFIQISAEDLIKLLHERVSYIQQRACRNVSGKPSHRQ